MPIKIEHLGYVYNPKTAFATSALTDINLTVNDGDFLGVIGHTGSGKSTLITHLNALTRIQTGAIFVDEIDLRPKKIDLKTPFARWYGFSVPRVPTFRRNGV